MANIKFVDKLPVAVPTRGNAKMVFVDTGNSNINTLTDLEEFSRLQSAVIVYSPSLPYKIGDLTLFNQTIYKNKTAITVGETFNPTKWEDPAAGNKVVNVKTSFDFPDAVNATIVNITNSGGVPLVTTTAPHNYINNNRIKVVGGTATYDGFHNILLVSPTTFLLVNATYTVDVTGGSLLRVQDANTTYVLFAPVTSAVGYAFEDSTSNEWLSTNFQVNTVTLTAAVILLSFAKLGFFRSTGVQVNGVDNALLLDVNGDPAAQSILVLDTFQSSLPVLGDLFDTFFFAEGSTFGNYSVGFTFNNTFHAFTNVTNAVNSVTPPASSVFITVDNPNIGFLQSSMTGQIPILPGPDHAVFDIKPSNPPQNRISITNSSRATPGVWFKPNGDEAITNIVADNVMTATVDAFADSVTEPGVKTTVTLSSISGGPFVNGREIFLTSSGAFDGIHRISNLSGFDLDIDQVFIAAQMTGGGASSSRSLMTTAVVPTLNSTINIRTPLFFRNQYLVEVVTASTFTINQIFFRTETGNWNTDSLTQRDIPIFMSNVQNEKDSRPQIEVFVNDNGQSMAFAITGEYIDQIYGPNAGPALQLSESTQKWRLMNDLNGEIQSLSEEEIEAVLVFNESIEGISGSGTPFRAAIFKNGLPLTPNFPEMKTSAGNNVVGNIGNAITVTVNKFDRLKVRLLDVAGTNTPTISYFTKVVR